MAVDACAHAPRDYLHVETNTRMHRPSTQCIFLSSSSVLSPHCLNTIQHKTHNTRASNNSIRRCLGARCKHTHPPFVITQNTLSTQPSTPRVKRYIPVSRNIFIQLTQTITQALYLIVVLQFPGHHQLLLQQPSLCEHLNQRDGIVDLGNAMAMIVIMVMTMVVALVLAVVLVLVCRPRQCSGYDAREIMMRLMKIAYYWC